MEPDMERLESLRAQHLVSTGWLASHLEDPAIRIVDMRGRVALGTAPDGSQTADYQGAREAYDAGHIPGALYLDWTTDLADLGDPVPAQAAPAEKFARVISEAGIGSGILVIAYDDHPASQFATRLWWLLRYYGHNGARVLDGGWQKWQREGLPASSDPAAPAPAQFVPSIQRQWRRTADEVWAGLCAGTETLIDARDPGQYSGAIRRGPRGGRIPGALSFPRESLMAPDGTFKPSVELCDSVQRLGIAPQDQVVAYCNGGVAATSALFALSMLGFERLANYDGSWNEWSAREDLPLESSQQ